MKKITIYTTEWCPDCWAAKRYLGEKGTPFEEVDIEKRPEAVQQVIAARGKKVVPTLEYNGRYIDGNHFNIDKFSRDLEELLS